MLGKNNKSRKNDVDNIKNHTAETLEKVHKWTFVAFEFLIYILMERVLFSRILNETTWINSIWCEIIRALIFAFSYDIIYKIVKKIYNRVIIKKHPRFDIGGDWYHVHIPNELVKGSARKSLSAGNTTVLRNLNDFTFVAKNFRYTVCDGKVVQTGEEAHTTWCTETSEICDGNEVNIVEVYKANSSGEQTTGITKCPVCGNEFENEVPVVEANEHRYGIHLYKIDTREGRMICTYSDCWPSLKSGKLYFYRTEEERDKKIKEYFKRHANAC